MNYTESTIYTHYQNKLLSNKLLSNKAIIKNHENPPILKVDMKYENLDGNTELKREQTDIENID